MKANYLNAGNVLRRLTAAGHKAYLAGGCVRDIILNLPPSDYDITTSATPDQVQKLFPKTVPVGASFGVVKVILDDKELDVATFRMDGKYSDNRRPDSVTFTPSAEEDVKRRDFTINALLMDADGNILDYVGGKQDLRSRILRTVGDPTARFREDALRMMRAVRFSIRFGFKIEEETFTAIKEWAHTVENISIERVTDELTKTFALGQCDRSFWMLNLLGLWRSWSTNLQGDKCWTAMHGLSRVRPNESFILPIAIIICDAWPGDRDLVLSKLSLTNAQRSGLESLLEKAKDLTSFPNRSLATKRRMMQWEDKEIILRFIGCQRHIGAYQWSLIPQCPRVEDVFANMKQVMDMGWPAPLITGEDLIGWGFIPHKVFTEILDGIRTEQLEGKLTDKNKVMDFILENYPAAPRTLPNGNVHDGMSRSTMVATCKRCSRSMRFTAEFNAKGKIKWGTAAEVVGFTGLNCGVFVDCYHCSTRKKKTKFVKAVM